MIVNSNHIQLIKFILTCIFSIIGLYYYVVFGGTLLKALIVLVVFWLITKVSTLAYHRWLAHNLIEPGPFGRAFLLWCMVVVCLTKPLSFVMGHRLHHKYSDTDKDPHHTKLGLWNFILGNFNLSANINRIPIKDFFAKKDVVFVDTYFYHLYVLNLLFFWWLDKDIVLLSFLLLNLRSWIGVSIFNYKAHGGEKTQTPVNVYSPLFAVLWAGEHLHKNHHDDPSAADFGKLTSNFDITYFLCKHLTKVKN